MPSGARFTRKPFDSIKPRSAFKNKKTPYKKWNWLSSNVNRLVRAVDRSDSFCQRVVLRSPRENASLSQFITPFFQCGSEKKTFSKTEKQNEKHMPEAAQQRTSLLKSHQQKILEKRPHKAAPHSTDRQRRFFQTKKKNNNNKKLSPVISMSTAGSSLITIKEIEIHFKA